MKVFLVLALLIGLAVLASVVRRKQIEQHKSNLLKGGLMPRAPKDVHQAAMKELGEQFPHRRLPPRNLYDP